MNLESQNHRMSRAGRGPQGSSPAPGATQIYPKIQSMNLASSVSEQRVRSRLRAQHSLPGAGGGSVPFCSSEPSSCSTASQRSSSTRAGRAGPYQEGLSRTVPLVWGINFSRTGFKMQMEDGRIPVSGVSALLVLSAVNLSAASSPHSFLVSPAQRVAFLWLHAVSDLWMAMIFLKEKN